MNNLWRLLMALVALAFLAYLNSPAVAGGAAKTKKKLAISPKPKIAVR